MQKPDISLFPPTPGVYLFKDATGRILYVGKAVRLRNRLASYFRPESSLTPKTRLMVQNAASIDILRTSTEKEALLLEASLIKKHRPRYNILLRDDKEYLLFRLRGDHPYPRLEIIRKSSLKGERKGGKKKNTASKSAEILPEILRKDRLYGPFSSGSAAHETWRLIHRTFPLRRCRDRSFGNRSRPCLYHHMGQCLGPCVLDVPPSEYAAMVDKVDLLLTGRSKELIEQVERDMEQAAETLEFERAALLRDQLKAVRRTVECQSGVLPTKANLDLIGVAQLPEGLALGVVFVRDGLLLDGRNFFWPGLGMEDTPELLQSFLVQYYLTGKANPPRRVVVPWLPDSPAAQTAERQWGVPLDEAGEGLTPERVEPLEEYLNDSVPAMETALSEAAGSPVSLGTSRNQDEDRLMLMAAENAKESAKLKASRPMAELLAEALHSEHPIHRVEIVDISHTSGRETRAGMVVFEAEQPVKSDYRTYALDEDLASFNTIPGEAGSPYTEGAAGDDYAALAIWARRRAASASPWPDLILIDGGKGQLAAVTRAFTEAGVTIATETDAAGEFVLASIAKARDEEGHADRRAGNVSDRIFLPGRSNPLPLKPGSPELLFLQLMRDTSHDFVIGRHRQARAKATLSGELTRLPGVGPKTARLLYDHFGSLAAMADANVEELMHVPGIGRERAAMLHERLRLLVTGNGEK